MSVFLSRISFILIPDSSIFPRVAPSPSARNELPFANRAFVFHSKRFSLPESRVTFELSLRDSGLRLPARYELSLRESLRCIFLETSCLAPLAFHYHSIIVLFPRLAPSSNNLNELPCANFACIFILARIAPLPLHKLSLRESRFCLPHKTSCFARIALYILTRFELSLCD